LGVATLQGWTARKVAVLVLLDHNGKVVVLHRMECTPSRRMRQPCFAWCQATAKPLTHVRGEVACHAKLPAVSGERSVVDKYI
jgi:hypothetical protein